ncbi:AraC family transcriptional regulator [Paenibacillus glycanilyticus]|uniref:HTH araC/xylS-type domain-containing protein n=1 Tax=Paenibacillus glycanilyticus TaxID=126569 RepID=A0ABQ6G9P1_9BACL|nr:AraC family transcriptional regulator [Paenibacillus glycanilyticus]GLX66965.1 hypothetical protein MU1_13090 [Paenibacillus glycanilyticus]
MATPVFEQNKNQNGGFEHPFYTGKLETVTDGYHSGYHWHYHLEMIYFTKGEAILEVGNGRKEVSAGDLILIYPCEVHAVIVEKGVASEHYVLGFDPEVLEPLSSLAFELRYVRPILASLDAHPRVLRLNKEDHKRMNSWVMEIYDEYRNQHIGFELAVTSILYQITLYLLRNPAVGWFRSSGDHRQVPPVHIRKFEQIIQYIHEHLHEDLSASMVSQQAMLSYSHFARLFKAMMHLSFTDYLHYLRIQRAEQQLVDSERSISEIAMALGYNDTSYFIKMFKRLKGISPNQYRKIVLQ